MVDSRQRLAVSPIAKKLVIALVLCSSFITLIATSIQLYFDYRHDIDRINSGISYIQESLVKSISQSVWVFDDLQVDLVLEGILQGQAIEYVAVSVDGKKRWQRGALKAKRSKQVEFPLLHDHRNQVVKIGTLHVAADLDQVYNHLFQRGAVILFSNGVKTLLVSAFFLAVFHYLVTRHLLVLSRFLSLLDPRQALEQLQLSGRNSENPDELDNVVTSINTMNGKIHRFIDEQKEQKEALAKSEAFLTSVFVSIQEGICVLDRDLNIVRVNPIIEQWYKDEMPVVGRKCHQCYQHSNDVCQNCPARRALESGMTEMAIIERPASSAVRWVEVYCYPLSDEKGVITGVVEFIRNISERVEAEKEKELLRNQLEQAQKMESIGRLTGGVAHDFNNILSAINGNAELLLMDIEDDHPFHKGLETIFNAGQRAARLTEQLLAFSRKQVIRPELLNLSKQVDDSRLMLDRLLGENIEIEIIHDSSLWPVRADRSQLEQVILNLAVNSRDAMADGGKLIIETTNFQMAADDVMSYQDIEPGDFVMLAVSDNGKGMDETTREHIFEPFFTTKKEGKGTGLGMATVYGIVKQNNGEIQVYSEAGIGTTFKIYLPRAGVDDKLEAGDSHSTPGVDNSIGGTETVLVVEDEKIVRELCVKALVSQGYTVSEAENGEKALEVFSRAEGKIDLLLTDVVMPKMSGPELVEIVLERYPETRIIYMSGYAETAIARHGVLADDVNFLHKPITPRAFLQAVRKALAPLHQNNSAG